MTEPITKEEMLERLGILDDLYRAAMFRGNWPVLGIQVHAVQIDAIRALIESGGDAPQPDRPTPNRIPYPHEAADALAVIARRNLMQRLPWLRDKIHSWPGEMALTSRDIADLLALIDAQEQAAPQPSEEERREMVKWFDVAWPRGKDRIGFTGPSWNELGDKIRALIVSSGEKDKPKVVTREWVEKFYNDWIENNPCPNGPVFMLRAILRELGIVVKSEEGKP